MSAFKNDGTIPASSVVLTIGTLVPGTPPTISASGAVTYVADNITFSRPGKTIERTDENDEPSGQKSYPGFVTGSATLQLATTSTAYPAQGQHFVYTTNSVVEAFYIDSVDQPLSKDAETKVNVTFRKAYNTSA